MILEVIRQQVEALRTPLAAVTLSTLPRKSSPLLLLLHWHGFAFDDRARPPPEMHERWRKSPLPSSALQLSADWFAIEQLDQYMLDAAWALGAWQLTREERRASNTVGASGREALECRQAFGDDPLVPENENHLVDEAPDRARLLAAANALGYVRWLFRPVANGLWRNAGQDDSLLTDGSRAPPCPVRPRPMVGTRTSHSRYQLGRVDRIVLT